MGCWGSCDVGRPVDSSENGKKRCSKCKALRPLDQYVKDGEGSRSCCVTCDKVRVVDSRDTQRNASPDDMIATAGWALGVEKRLKRGRTD